MQVTAAETLLRAEPGTTVDVVVDVVNTSELIDGVTATVLGLDEATSTVEPALLPLFPDARGQLRVSLHVPGTVPAGVHPLSIVLHSHAGLGTRHVNVDLAVSARPAVTLKADPPVVRARRNGRFLLEVANTGNTPLDAQLSAEREDRATSVRFTPENLRLEPGAATAVICVVRGPRMFTGSDIDRRVAIDLRARSLTAPTLDPLEAVEEPDELRVPGAVTLRQRPMVSRGLLTALILVGIVTLWALAFLLGISQVFRNDPLTKTVPTTFPTSTVGASEAGAGAAGGDGAEEGATVPGTAPPGALAKSGLVPATVGGSISGTVTATSNLQPVGRIMVRAYRQGRNGPVLVSSAATQSDGSYTISGLFPTEYRLTYTAQGYETLWYPAATARRGASPVAVGAQSETTGINAVIEGKPASITGSISPGDALDPPVTTVTARMVSGPATTPASPGATPTTPGQPAAATGAPAARTTSAADGSYTLSNLPAPATYELSFSAEGYQVTKVLTKVAGGENRLQPAVVPGAGKGAISGTVTSGSAPLGNVTVSTTVAGEKVQVTTPTVGQVGAFTLGNLPTPGTYVLEFSAPSHGTTTRIVDLEAGRTESGLKVDLTVGSGSVQGILTAADGTGLGGATVTVGGASLTGGTTGDTAAAPSTTTLTTGTVGSFSLSGLVTPGEYTLTFELDGYTAETVPVSLSASGSVSDLTVVLGTKLGRISGSVTGPDGKAWSGATVTVTDGSRTWTTTSTAPGGALATGGYQVADLPPGTYSVTVSADGLRQQTAMVSVQAGINSIQKLQLRSP